MDSIPLQSSMNYYGTGQYKEYQYLNKQKCDRCYEEEWCLVTLDSRGDEIAICQQCSFGQLYSGYWQMIQGEVHIIKFSDEKFLQIFVKIVEVLDKYHNHSVVDGGCWPLDMKEFQSCLKSVVRDSNVVKKDGFYYIALRGDQVEFIYHLINNDDLQDVLSWDDINLIRAVLKNPGFCYEHHNTYTRFNERQKWIMTS